MKGILCWVMLLWCMTVPALGAELPADLTKALPEGVENMLESVDPTGADGFSEGLISIGRQLTGQAGEVLRKQSKGVASLLLVVILCGAAEGFAGGVGGKGNVYLSMAGAISVTLLTAGNLDSMMGIGAGAMEELQAFSHVLLPTLAAAAAASGALTTATVQQVAAVFLVDLLLNLMNDLLVPLLYLYIGMLTASACLPESRLSGLADGLKKFITWVLTTALVLFTLYLSVSRVISGNVDGATVRMTKSAISGVVPVVGGIIAEASETVLAGAGLLKGTIGVFGMLAIFAICAYPFLQLGIQYLLYKLAAVLSTAVGPPSLCRLISGLGGAFGLVLGMTGTCVLLLLVSVLSSVAAVLP